MANRYPKFQNDRAVSEIGIETGEFKFIGVSPLHDHPHVYIDMGDDDTILCPYYATRYRFDHLPWFGFEQRQAWPTCCLKLDPVKTKLARIKLIDKVID